jgi:hypothetical protein
MTASWMLNTEIKQQMLYNIQIIVCFLILVLVAILNTWGFGVKNSLIGVGTILLLSVVFYFLKTHLNPLQKGIAVSVATITFSFFLLNTNFYPQLLKYQAGNELAKKIKGNVDPANIYFWTDNYSSSFNFYTITERKQFADSIFTKGKKPIWLLFDGNDLDAIRQAGYKLGLTYRHADFEITKLDLKFLNPPTRKSQLKEMMIAEITGKE